jgi:pimeloyl-ACP methyl ester carboxylesterase/DNA-binding CsgD family transcriptional regulator
MRRLQQSIRYLKTTDGVQLAWASTGSGPPLVKAANWLSHLQYDLESPIWLHWIRFFSRYFRFIRYDERGCGMTQWDVPEMSLERGVDDLEAVIAAAAPDTKSTLVGMSQGAATSIAYAVRHPERVSHLILYGGYATGWARRGDAEGLRRYMTYIELVRQGWDSENSAFRQVFTWRFVPGASPQQLEWFNELCRRATSPKALADLMLTRIEVDVRELLPKISVPTLVLHAAADEVTPISQSRELAASIPNAEFVQLESRNHILMEDEPAWSHFRDVVLQFTGRAQQEPTQDRFAELTGRERDVLAALVAGCSNAQIATNLNLSEKTIRNMLTRIFEKLRVRSRTQAIVLARDHGFGV